MINKDLHLKIRNNAVQQNLKYKKEHSITI